MGGGDTQIHQNAIYQALPVAIFCCLLQLRKRAVKYFKSTVFLQLLGSFPADAAGNAVSNTYTLSASYGAHVVAPGTGILLNNGMTWFDPVPGHVNSIAPGKRITSSMAPVIALRGGKPRWALGLPGGLRIFPSVMQAISNLIDHGMTVQEAVEAPRVWTQGHSLEIETGFSDAVFAAMRARGARKSPRIWPAWRGPAARSRIASMARGCLRSRTTVRASGRTAPHTPLPAP